MTFTRTETFDDQTIGLMAETLAARQQRIRELEREVERLTIELRDRPPRLRAVG